MFSSSACIRSTSTDVKSRDKGRKTYAWSHLRSRSQDHDAVALLLGDQLTAKLLSEINVPLESSKTAFFVVAGSNSSA